MIKVSVLILTKNGGPEFRTCLEGVCAQTQAGEVEIIVVDSGSTDGTLEFVERFPIRLEQIPPETFHHARTRNFAATLAKGEVLVFLSQDAVPTSNRWLKEMVGNFEDLSVGAVYGRQLPKEESSLERQDLLDAVYGVERIVKDPALRNGLGYRFYHFSDVNSAIRRSVWETTRFPEDLNVFEDLGIAKRILDAGWKIVYDPEAAVFHSHHHTTMGLFKRYFDIGYTLRHLQISDAPGTSSSLLRDGWRILGKKLRRFKSNGGRRRALAAVGQDIAKSAGLLLGLKRDYLPFALKRHLSAHGVHK
jgi:rhamnosyltransferase